MHATLAILAQQGGAPSGQGGGAFGMFLPLILIFLIMWLLIFRPQAKKQKQHQQMVSNVQKGDKVLTVGGMYGTIAGFKENDSVVVLKIDDNVKIDFLKSSIAQNMTAESRNAKEKDKK